jgi:hypothetical protein
MPLIRRIAPIALLTLGLMAPSVAQDVLPTPPETTIASAAKQWADDIWTAARTGDAQTLSARFRTVPEEAWELEAASRVRDSFELHQANETRASAKREEARDKAAGEMREQLASGELSKALRSAVTVQTLGDHMEAAFEDADINTVIAWAEKRIPELEAELDWLSAQELLFYLRTLYEDTNRFDAYTKYKDELNAVNRRVSLLAQYAPQQLHELRIKRAERLGDPPLPEYRPNPSNEWRSKNKEIRPDMLRTSLKTAATEHIDASGWRPLIIGGLNELKLLATTASLSETFPAARK